MPLLWAQAWERWAQLRRLLARHWELQARLLGGLRITHGKRQLVAPLVELAEALAVMEVPQWVLVRAGRQGQLGAEEPRQVVVAHLTLAQTAVQAGLAATRRIPVAGAVRVQLGLRSQ